MKTEANQPHPLRGFRWALAAALIAAPSISSIAKAQVAVPKPFIYATGTSSLGSAVATTDNFLFGSPNAIFDFENVQTPTEPTIYVKKGAGYHGIFAMDNNPGDSSTLNHVLNIELYNITELRDGGSRSGIRVHLDPTNTATGSLNGIEIGNHGPTTTGLVVATAGANGAPTAGIGIESLCSGVASILTTEGDATHTSLPTVGVQLNHFTAGSMLKLYQLGPAMTGDFIFGNTSGALSGNFVNFNVNNLPKFRVDATGNALLAGYLWSSAGLYLGSEQNAAIFYDGSNLNLSPRVTGSGSVVVAAGTIVIPAIKAKTGTRFVCVDAAGNIISQVTPCSGT